MFAKDYIILALSEEHLANAEPVTKRLRQHDGGIPWMVILDATGQPLVTSDGPNGNIGYPFEEHEISHFIDMLTRTRQRIADEDLSLLTADLKAYADSARKARNDARQGG